MGIISFNRHSNKNFFQKIKDAYWKTRLNLPKGSLAQLVIAAVIVISLPLAVYFSLRPASFTSRADVDPVDIFFAPDTQNLPPDSLFKILLDSRSHSIAFVRLVMTFDNTKLNLTSEISTMQLNTVVKKTSMSDANSSGRAEIVLGLTPGDPAPSSVFELAEFSLTSLSSVDNDAAALLIDNVDIQIVDSTAQAQSGNITPANLILNYVAPTATSTPTSTPSPTPTLSPTPTPEDPVASNSATLTPTATSTPTSTPSPTPEPPTSTPSPTPYPTLPFSPSLTPTNSPTPTGSLTDNQSLSTATPTNTSTSGSGSSSVTSSGGGSSSGGSSGSTTTSSSGGRKRGDANGDGKVNILDLSIILSEWGK